MENFKRLSLYSLFLSTLVITSSTLDMITPNQPIKDGKNENETLVSTNGTFEAGFFNPPENSKSRYFGIWYKNIFPKAVVWVANRETPLSDHSGVLEVDSEGNLKIMDGTKGVKIWSSNASKTTEKKPVIVVVQLLESGNMVVKNGHNNNLEGMLLWQSFDYPGDTFLPGMKIGRNLRTGQNWSLRSWKTLDDPTPGEFSFHVDIQGLPQLVITQEGTRIYRPGSWNGLSVTGIPEEVTDQIVKSLFVMNSEEVFYEIELISSSVIMRSRLTPKGYQVRLIWSHQTQQWDMKYPGPFDQCERYAMCGVNTNCDGKGSENCECLTGFKANSAYSAGKLSGCVRTTPEECNSGDISDDDFHKYEGMKLPDTSSSWYDKTIGLVECEKLCLRNCSCTAYAKLNISGNGSGCLHWFSDIVDLRKLPEGGQDFYLRVTAASNLGNCLFFHYLFLC